MIEGVNKAQALIEKLLCFRVRGGNRMMKVTQPAHQCDGMRLHVSGMILRYRAESKQQTAQNRSQSFHLVHPPTRNRFEPQLLKYD